MTRKNSQLNSFLAELETELVSGILPYWSERMLDHDSGGFYGRVDGFNVLHREAPKGSVLNARILWTFSTAYTHYGNEKYLEVAERAYRYCKEVFMNRERGGVFWLVDFKGNPLDRKNQIYALAFMIYGFTAYYQATKTKEALDEAINLFGLIEKHSYDPVYQGYFEAFDENWNLLDDLRLSAKDANEKKTMNTHLHILEAYTSLYRPWPDLQLKLRLTELVHVFMNHILDNETAHFSLFFDEAWQVQGKVISFGHDIEGSWLLLEAAEATGDTGLIERAKIMSVQMVDAVAREGIDIDGAIFYESESKGIIQDKHWWPQAEAMVGFVNAFQLTGDQAYLGKTYHLWEFIKKNMIDRKHGEWFFYVNRDGKPYLDEDKAGFWKCPYHNSRACLEILNRIG